MLTNFHSSIAGSACFDIWLNGCICICVSVSVSSLHFYLFVFRFIFEISFSLILFLMTSILFHLSFPIFSLKIDPLFYFYHSHSCLIHFVSEDTQNCGFDPKFQVYSFGVFILISSFPLILLMWCRSKMYDSFHFLFVFVPFICICFLFVLYSSKIPKIYIKISFFLLAKFSFGSRKKFWIKMCNF